MQRKYRVLLSLLFLIPFSGCAILHHVQLGEIDNRNSTAMIPFEILMSEAGVSTEDIGILAKASNSNGGDALANLAAVVAMFQLGPRTGNLVYNERYAEKLIYQIHEKCPSGQVTGLMSIREMRMYPVISGEIVKVTGYCRKTRTTASIQGVI